MTADEKSQTEEKAGKIISTIYSAYYIKEEAENAFVLEDDGLVVGYIVCAKNYKDYSKKFRKIYAEEVKKLDFSAGVFAKMLPLTYLVFSKKYPAHLHIDINADFTGNGNGTKMMTALLEHLKSKNVKGVMLIVGAHNTAAVRFYKRNGFKILCSLFGGTAMAKEL
jgi:ribosomal protein S18 acetylase RimI-like enzyme